MNDDFLRTMRKQFAVLFVAYTGLVLFICYRHAAEGNWVGLLSITPSWMFAALCFACFWMKARGE